MARDSANASSFQERSATLCLAVSAPPSVLRERSQTGAPSQTVFPYKHSGTNSLPILSNNVPFPFTCHASLRTQVMFVHLLALVMVDYFRGTYTNTNTQTARSFLRINSLWSVSAWLGKAHFLPSIHSLQDHTEHTH